MEPRSQQSLDAAIHFRTKLIVGQSYAALERFGKLIEHRHLLWQRTESAGEKEGIVLVRQDQRAFRTQLETSFPDVVEQVRRCLSVEPFANPSLV